MDIKIEDHGSIVLLIPISAIGEQWVDENLNGPETQRWGRGVVVEPRYVLHIVEGARGDGLEVE
jgi:hypothetical protein